MKSRHDRNTFKFTEMPAYIRHAFISLKKKLGCDFSQRNDHPGIDKFDLTQQIGGTGFNLIRPGVLFSGGRHLTTLVI